ncbi:MAG TPA: redoxin domain-containing protein [Burkholderiales bacterium]|nr:redoxin domain-containing protein [Burkholderiales bacterium]
MTAKTTLRWVGLLSGAALAASLHAAPKPGAPAPDFALTDIDGKAVTLAEFKGKHVVLEWTNPNCPYVGKHYDTGNMQSLQKSYAGKQVIWLSIASTRPGHPEYASEKQIQQWLGEKKAAPTRAILDKDGKVGRLYDARTTPHMFVIDPQGRLVFAGGIDDKRTWSHEDVKTAKNFVRAALDESLAGKPVTVASAVPYG